MAAAMACLTSTGVFPRGSMGRVELHSRAQRPFLVQNFDTQRQRSCEFRSCQVTAGDPAVEIQNVKSALSVALEGLNRGIFGVKAPVRAEIHSLITSLEELNPLSRPTENLDKLKGEWKLLYSTITILGIRRTKLGLRDFVSLREFLQIIDVEQKKAVTKILFGVPGLGHMKGTFTIEASYSVSSPTRVNVQYENSYLDSRLHKLFQENYALLLEIFNPQGWLEITYVDETLRVCRDDKGNVFLVERT